MRDAPAMANSSKRTIMARRFGADKTATSAFEFAMLP
jgi:hypothetical protein